MVFKDLIDLRLETIQHKMKKEEQEQITNEALKSGFKADAGKTRVSLIPPQFIMGLADVFTRGADKYSEYNWALGMKYSRVYDAMQRHANKWLAGETFDEVDGQHHLLSTAWNACILYFFELFPEKYRKFDDRLCNLKYEDIIINTTARN